MVTCRALSAPSSDCPTPSQHHPPQRPPEPAGHGGQQGRELGDGAMTPRDCFPPVTPLMASVQKGRPGEALPLQPRPLTESIRSIFVFLKQPEFCFTLGRWGPRKVWRVLLGPAFPGFQASGKTLPFWHGFRVMRSGCASVTLSPRGCNNSWGEWGSPVSPAHTWTRPPWLVPSLAAAHLGYHPLPRQVRGEAGTSNCCPQALQAASIYAVPSAHLYCLVIRSLVRPVQWRVGSATLG